MPDAQTMNAVLGAYGLSGLSGLIGGGGGFNWWNIIGGIIFSIIGWCAFSHGRREKSVRPMVIGLVLMIYPYFVANTLLFFAVGIALSAALHFWKE